jgi:hypothetical protein
VSLATIESIRDRILTVIEGLTPASLSADKFRRYRAELSGNFEEWVEKNPSACLRRVSAYETGSDEGPVVSCLTHETVNAQIEIRIAYPQTHRYGADNTRDRLDVIKQDWKKIKYAISGDGGDGKANFTTATDESYDCCPLPASMEIERSAVADYMVIRWRCEYTRSTT